jgi:hypothetical protein
MLLFYGTELRGFIAPLLPATKSRGDAPDGDILKGDDLSWYEFVNKRSSCE